MASSPLGRMRLKGMAPTPGSTGPTPGFSSATGPAEGAWTRAAGPPGPGRISGSDSLAGGAEAGLVAGGLVVDLETWGLVGVVGLVRPRLARASRVPSGSTITLITERSRKHSCQWETG